MRVEMRSTDVQHDYALLASCMLQLRGGAAQASRSEGTECPSVEVELWTGNAMCAALGDDDVTYAEQIISN